MIGGPPVFAPPMPGSMPAPMPRGNPASAGGYTPPRLPAPSRPAAQAELPAPRLARGVRGSEPTRSTPTPEELRIASASRPETPAPSAEPLDWTATRRQLADLGVTRFGLEPLAGGKVRFSCWVAASAGEAPTLVQADGVNERDA